MCPFNLSPSPVVHIGISDVLRVLNSLPVWLWFCTIRQQELLELEDQEQKELVASLDEHDSEPPSYSDSEEGREW